MSHLDKDKAIDKIMKCLALSKSANEHEAATALRHARALMEKHAITDVDIMAANASEETVRSGAKSKPVSWEAHLAHKITEAFGCDSLFQSGNFKAGCWVFIGCGAGPKIATYAFHVLFRQVKAARKSYIAENLKRCKPATRTKRADIFCLGWIRTATELLTPLVPEEECQSAITAYMAQHHPCITQISALNRGVANLRDGAHKDWHLGRMTGQKAQLHHGMETQVQHRLTGEC